MKQMLFALLLWPLMVATAYAEVKLEPPQALLRRAEMSRAEAREVILDIQANVSEFVDPQTFDSYFYILDDLQKIADEKGVNEIYPNAVRTLGQQMVANGIRWLTASRDSLDRIMYYHRWMNVEIAASFLSNVELEEKTLSPSESLVFARIRQEPRGADSLYRRYLPARVGPPPWLPHRTLRARRPRARP